MRARRIASLSLVALFAYLAVAHAIPARRVLPAGPRSSRIYGRHVTGKWKTYRSRAGGYSIRYPRSWRVDALAPLPAVAFTTFAPPTGAAGIRVYAYPGHGPGGDNMPPDVRCHPVSVAGVSGRRCRQLGTLAPVTILTTATRTYRISLLGGVRVATYDRVMNSFRATPGWTT